MDLSVKQLRMLREVANQGTIAAAADRLGYTPSAVSQQLSAAEKSAGIAVLERVGRNVVLTDAGRELVGHADTVLRHLEEAQTALERMQGEVAGTVRLGVLESVASSMLGTLLGRLRAAYPQLKVRTNGLDGLEVYSRLRSGELDVVSVVDYPTAPGPQPADIKRTLMCYDWFRVALPASRFGDGPVPASMPVEELAGEEFIGPPFADACGRSVVETCRRAGFEPDIAHSLADYPVVLRMVGAGVGVALVPDLGLRHVPDGVALVDLEEPECRTVEWAYRASSSERPAIEALINGALTLADEFGLDTSGVFVPLGGE